METTIGDSGLGYDKPVVLERLVIYKTHNSFVTSPSREDVRLSAVPSGFSEATLSQREL